MIVEIVMLFVLLAGLAIFGLVSWRLTLHVIGLDQQELAAWRARLRTRRAPEVSSD